VLRSWGEAEELVAAVRSRAGGALAADESVAALDTSVQATILNLVADLHRHLGLTVMFISHDLAVVRRVGERLVAMHLGRIVKSGPCRCRRPKAPAAGPRPISRPAEAEAEGVVADAARTARAAPAPAPSAPARWAARPAMGRPACRRVAGPRARSGARGGHLTRAARRPAAGQRTAKSSTVDGCTAQAGRERRARRCAPNRACSQSAIRDVR